MLLDDKLEFDPVLCECKLLLKSILLDLLKSNYYIGFFSLS